MMHASSSRSFSRTRTVSALASGPTSPHPGKADNISLKKNRSLSTTVSKKKKSPKPYEPIRLPEDILTIQAHTCSTPVTELPYLLIAAHIGALPTARQFYPATSSTHSPLTVFRDMFVMTVDVRGYKPNSVRLSTEGHLIIIECLQSEVPQVVHTQTGTVDSDDKYVMDPAPRLNSMPVHTSFNYVQHRVKLPDDFAEEGLKVGMDDVSGHIIITGRLVHTPDSAFPEPWNKNKVVKKSKGPVVNTSSLNLSREDARKLAAWQAVQGRWKDKSTELINTSLLQYGRKQWLEKEGAKLRAIQHKALKSNIKKLTEMKKSNASGKPSSSDTKSQSNAIQGIPPGQRSAGKSSAHSKEQLDQNRENKNRMDTPTTPNDSQGNARVSSSFTKLVPVTTSVAPNNDKHHIKTGGGGKGDKQQVKDGVRKESSQGGTANKKKSKMEGETTKKKSVNKIEEGKDDKNKVKKKSKTPQSDESDNKSSKKKVFKPKMDTPKNDPGSPTSTLTTEKVPASVPHYIKDQVRTNMNFVSTSDPTVQEGSSDPAELLAQNFHDLTPEPHKLDGVAPSASVPDEFVNTLIQDTIAGAAAANAAQERGGKTSVVDTPTRRGGKNPALHASSSVPGGTKPLSQIKEARTELFDLAVNHDTHFSGQDDAGSGVVTAHSSHSALTRLDELQKGVKVGAAGIQGKEEISDDPVGQQDKKMWETMLTLAAKSRKGKNSRSPRRVSH